MGIEVAVRKEDLDEELRKERMAYQENHGPAQDGGTVEREGIIREGSDGRREGNHDNHEIVDLNRPFRDPPVKFTKAWVVEEGEGAEGNLP